jgi:hypothetical protein
MVAAAIIQQMADDAADACAVHGIEQMPPVAPRTDQPGLFQRGEMERQARGGQPQGAPDIACGKPGIACGNHMADKRKPLFIGERLQGDEGFTWVHGSTIQGSLKYP